MAPPPRYRAQQVNMVAISTKLGELSLFNAEN